MSHSNTRPRDVKSEIAVSLGRRKHTLQKSSEAVDTICPGRLLEPKVLWLVACCREKTKTRLIVVMTHLGEKMS